MSKEAMKLALEAINNLITSSHATDPQHWRDARQDAVTALAAIDKALAEQPAQQEPVAIALNTGTKQGVKWLKNVEHGESLYTTSQPAQRTWVGLTDEEHEQAKNVCLHVGVEGLVFWLDDKLREKNA